MCNPVPGYRNLPHSFTRSTPGCTSQTSSQSCFQPVTASLFWIHNLLLFPFYVFVIYSMYVISYAISENLSIRFFFYIYTYRKSLRLFSHLSFAPSPPVPYVQILSFDCIIKLFVYRLIFVKLTVMPTSLNPCEIKQLHTIQLLKIASKKRNYKEISAETSSLNRQQIRILY